MTLGNVSMLATLAYGTPSLTSWITCVSSQGPFGNTQPTQLLPHAVRNQSVLLPITENSDNCRTFRPNQIDRAKPHTRAPRPEFVRSIIANAQVLTPCLKCLFPAAGLPPPGSIQGRSHSPSKGVLPAWPRRAYRPLQRKDPEQPFASGLGLTDQLAQNLTKLAEQRAIEQFRKEG
jgi:hypothetical protein